MKLALLALAALVSGSMVSTQAHAQAHNDSRAICKERETLAVNYQADAHKRFAEGEVARTDVAQSDLGVLDVQLACNLIRTSTYVNEASTLATVALNGTVYEAKMGVKTAEDVKAAQAKVAAVAALDKGQAQCNAKVAGLQATLQKLNEQFKRGEVSRVEINDATLAILGTQLKCGSILIGTYCSTAPALAQSTVAGISEEVRVGQQTSYDLMVVQQAELTVRSTCL